MTRRGKKKLEMEEKLRQLLWILAVLTVFFLTGALMKSASVSEYPSAPDSGIEPSEAGADGYSLSPPDGETAASPGVEEPNPTYPTVADEVYAPPSGDKPILAIVVDDGGNQMTLTKRVASTGLPLTWAILPYTRFASSTAKLADSKRIPYLLHLPMQAESDQNGSEQYIIGRGMSAIKISETAAKALDSLPNAIGLNNHRGSLATSDSAIMEPVMAELKKRGGLMFLDSRTSTKSVAYDVASAKGVPALRNRGFLDGSADIGEIEKRFAEIIRLAAKRGNAVVICHFRPATIVFLESLSGKKDSLPVRLVTIPEMLKLLNTKDH